MTEQAWTLVLPDSPFTSANSRHHWRQRAQNTAVWRQAAHLLARQAKIPPSGHVTVRLDYWPKDRRRRDPDNLVPGVLKPAVDGLVDAGIVPDDAPDYVTLTMPKIHEPRPDRQPRWELTITRR